MSFLRTLNVQMRNSMKLISFSPRPHVQILLLHEASKGSFSRVFDFEANDDLNERTSPFESRFPINIGITGHSAATGEVNTPTLIHPSSFFIIRTCEISFYSVLYLPDI